MAAFRFALQDVGYVGVLIGHPGANLTRTGRKSRAITAFLPKLSKAMPIQDGAERRGMHGTGLEKLSDAKIIFWTSDFEGDCHEMFRPQYPRPHLVFLTDPDHFVERVI